MAWHRSGDKPLSEPMVVSLSTHICVTRPQWVNSARASATIMMTEASWHMPGVLQWYDLDVSLNQSATTTVVPTWSLYNQYSCKICYNTKVIKAIFQWIITKIYLFIIFNVKSDQWLIENKDWSHMKVVSVCPQEQHLILGKGPDFQRMVIFKFFFYYNPM